MKSHNVELTEYEIQVLVDALGTAIDHWYKKVSRTALTNDYFVELDKLQKYFLDKVGLKDISDG
jgi:hypothetical protein